MTPDPSPDLWLENRRGATTLGIGEASPRLSWLLPGVDGDIRLRIQHADGEHAAATINAQAHLRAWPSRALTSRERVEVTLWPTGEQTAEPLLRTIIEAGLLDAGDWTSDFVSPSPVANPGALRPAYLMRATWSPQDLGMTAADVDRVRLYSTAHGVYELECNGVRVDSDVLAPGWTSYRHRLRYRTHDLTGVLRDGTNVVGAWLADGWYRGRIGFDGGRWDVYGHDVSLLAQLEVTTRDGQRHTVPLTPWRWSASPITAAGLYEGERYDAALEQPGWSTPDFDDAAWTPATALPRTDFDARLEAPTAAPVTVTDILKPQTVSVTDGGRIRLDFGQNISGKLRIRIDGPAGHVVRLHHAEVLENGQLGTRPLRTAISVDEYVCGADGPVDWTPRFTLHGFRYAELEGWPGGLDTLDAVALVVHTRMTRTSWFTCSDPRLNQLYDNIGWSMRDNFVDLPTDCPQRDERCGWTGDIQIFARTALTMYACHGTLTGWLRDVAAEQAAKGHVPNFVPWIDCGFPDHPTAGWGDAAVIVPWEMYKHDNDAGVLRDQYASMRAWVDLVDGLTQGTGLWTKQFQLGDWLDPAAPPDDPGRSHTDRDLVATAYHVRTSRILAATAELLGHDDDAARYTRIAATAATAFAEEYVSPSGRVVSDTPTALAVAIVFDLLARDDQRDVAGRRLADLVAANDYRIPTGFVGTPLICDALTQTGHPDAAYRLLLQQDCPSWLYPVTMGATTVWERWDSMLPDGTVNPGDMTSFNHYALGAVADFLHTTVAGLRRPASASPAEYLFTPVPGGGLTHAGATHHSPWGTVTCAWTLADDGDFDLAIELPDGVTGQVLLPGTEATRTIAAGQHTFRTRLDPHRIDQHGRTVGALVRSASLPT